MDLWEISKDVFTDLIHDIRDKTIENLEYNETCLDSILNILPIEILELIFTYLPPADLYNVRSVCKKFKKAATSPQVLQLNPSNYIDSCQITSEVVKPFLNNLVSLQINVGNVSAIDGVYDSESAIELLKLLSTECLNLRNLRTSLGCISAEVSMEHLSERLLKLSLDATTFQDANKFFMANGKSLFKNLKELEISACRGFKNSLPFANVSDLYFSSLQVLRLFYMDDFGNEELRPLHKTLGHITELTMTGIQVDNDVFDGLRFNKLTELTIESCQIKDNWLSHLKNMPELVDLRIVEVPINDSCARDSFKNLVKLKNLEIRSCQIGNRTTNAMMDYLPKLENCKLFLLEDGTVTDIGFMSMTRHPCLQILELERVRLTDVGVCKIATMCPALQTLRINICNCSDEAFDVIGRMLTALTRLYVNFTRVTDVGLMHLKPRFPTLKEFHMESVFVTGAAVSQVIPLLESALNINLTFGEQECEINYYSTECESDYTSLSFKGTGLGVDVVHQLCKRFTNCNTLTLTEVTIGQAEIDCIATNQAKINTMNINQSVFNEVVNFEMLFTKLEDLNITQSTMSNEQILKLFQCIKKPLDRFTLQNNEFPSEEVLTTVVANVTELSYVHIAGNGFSSAIIVSNNEYDKSITITGDGTAVIGDNILVAWVQPFKNTLNLAIEQTSVTDVGMAFVTTFLTELTYLRIKSDVITDETMKLIGNSLPALKSLNVEADIVTDEGLLVLGKHLTSLECLYVTKSKITDEGIKRVAPLLGEISYLGIYDNPNVTSEVITYMKETYPNIEHILPPEAEPEEAGWAIGDPVEPVGEDDAAAAAHVEEDAEANVVAEAVPPAVADDINDDQQVPQMQEAVLEVQVQAAVTS